MKINELPHEVREFALNSYLGNEVGSDQYRDAQPESGLNAAASYFSNTGANMTRGLTEEQIEMLKELRTWLDAIITEAEGITSEPTEHGYSLASNMYPGVDALDPVLTREFNAAWDRGVAPYEATADDLLADYELFGKKS